MRKWVLLGLILLLALALAACDGDDKKDDETPSGGDDLTTTPAPLASPDNPPDAPQDFTVYDPGLNLQSGLLVTPYTGVRDGTGYFFGEVTNATGELIGGAEMVIYVLNTEHYRVDTVHARSLLSDIPPDQTFYMGASFPVPAGVTNVEDFTQIFVNIIPRPEDDTTPPYQGYVLPVTITERGAGGGVPYIVRGTVENNTDQALFALAIDVVLIGPDDGIVGFGNGTYEPGKILAMGESLSFETAFRFVAVDPALIQDVRVLATGYASR